MNKKYPKFNDDNDFYFNEKDKYHLDHEIKKNKKITNNRQDSSYYDNHNPGNSYIYNKNTEMEKYDSKSDNLINKSEYVINENNLNIQGSKFQKNSNYNNRKKNHLNVDYNPNLNKKFQNFNNKVNGPYFNKKDNINISSPNYDNTRQHISILLNEDESSESKTFLLNTHRIIEK